MSVRHLTVNQTHDPSRGSFLINPTRVRDKRVDGGPVYFSCVHVDLFGAQFQHPGGFEFVLVKEAA